jgi:soluble lytic murein transglycosylase
MRDEYGRPIPQDPAGPAEDSDTVEHLIRGSQAHRAQGAGRGSRGYWIEAPQGGAPARGGSPGPSGARAGRRHKSRVFLWMSARLFPIHYQQEIAQVAGQYGQDPYLVAAMARTESAFDAQAESPAGAVGLMQLMPDTAEWVAGKMGDWQGGSGPVLTDPVDNLQLGVWYLDYLGGLYGDGSLATLAAYNAGLGNVDKWIAAAGGLEAFDDSYIAFTETRQYVERVEHYRALFVRVHPDAFAQTSQ